MGPGSRSQLDQTQRSGVIIGRTCDSPLRFALPRPFFSFWAFIGFTPERCGAPRVDYRLLYPPLAMDRKITIYFYGATVIPIRIT